MFLNQHINIEINKLWGRKMKKLFIISFLVLLSISLGSIPALGKGRTYNVGISDTAVYKIEKFQWNAEFTLVDNFTIDLADNSVLIVKDSEFTLTVTSVGSNALLCNFEEGMNTLEVICSSSFLDPYIPQLIIPTFSSFNDWSIYADTIESSFVNINIQLDDKYYQEAEEKNSSGVIETRFLQYNIQNGFLYKYYYQYYEEPDFKNYREVQIQRQDSDSWTTVQSFASSTVQSFTSSTASGGEYYILFTSIFTVYLLRNLVLKKKKPQ